MGLNWPAMQMTGGAMTDEREAQIKPSLDAFGDGVTAALGARGLRPHASPVFRPWNLFVVEDAASVHVAFTPLTGGAAQVLWHTDKTQQYSPVALYDLVENQHGMSMGAYIQLAVPEDPMHDGFVRVAVEKHVAEVMEGRLLDPLGDLTGLEHLKPHLEQFLAAHPDYERNVFVMMPFRSDELMPKVWAAVRETLARYGMKAHRADDRDYTGELWNNIEVYMTCCKYGIAVFEQIDQREFNPNVSLELGFMMGRRKRTLILKEQRLPNLPADVIHRLYRPFDIFHIEDSVGREVGQWAGVDLGFQAV